MPIVAKCFIGVIIKLGSIFGLFVIIPNLDRFGVHTTIETKLLKHFWL